jgi:broad specificity phosphatase PhoE
MRATQPPNRPRRKPAPATAPRVFISRQKKVGRPPALARNWRAMIELYLLRHAQSEINAMPEAERTIGGRSPMAALTALGVEQARAAGAEIARAGFGFDGVFCSTARRARQTLENAAAPAPALRAAPAVFSEKLEETDMGAWVGRRRVDTYTRELLARIAADPLGFRPEGGETSREAGARVLGFVREAILERRRQGRFLLVGHAWSGRCFLRECLGFPPQLIVSLAFSNAHFSKLVFDAGAWELKFWNERWLL